MTRRPLRNQLRQLRHSARLGANNIAISAAYNVSQLVSQLGKRRSCINKLLELPEENIASINLSGNGGSQTICESLNQLSNVYGDRLIQPECRSAAPLLLIILSE